MAPLVVSFLLILTYVHDVSGQCSYVNYFGYPQPTELCVFKNESNGEASSFMFHCTKSNGIELQAYDNKYCSDTPTSKSLLNTNLYEYNCDGEPEDCSQASFVYDSDQCSSTSYYTKIVFAMDICSYSVNNDFSTYVTCGGVDVYYNDDCSGDPVYVLDTTSSSMCGSSWNCDYDSSSSSSTGIIDKATAQVTALSTAAIIAIIIGVLICFIFAIICTYCVCCRNTQKKQTANNNYQQLNNNNNNFVAMGNVNNSMHSNHTEHTKNNSNGGCCGTNNTSMHSHNQNNSMHSNMSSNISIHYVPVQPIQPVQPNLLPSAPRMSTIGTTKLNEAEQGPLPNGWAKAVSNDGQIYYQNHITKQTRWDRPTENITPEGGAQFNV